MTTITIGDMCMETSPCKHWMGVDHGGGETWYIRSARLIALVLAEHGVDYRTWAGGHFNQGLTAEQQAECDRLVAAYRGPPATVRWLDARTNELYTQEERERRVALATEE